MEKQLVLKSGLEEILRISSQIMSKKGNHATSMRDLAKATNLSLAGLYHYFESKQDLIYLINFRGFLSLLKHAQEVEKLEVPVDEKLHAFIQSHIQYFCAHRSDMRVMMFGTHEIDEAGSAKIRNIKEAYRVIGRDIVRDYMTEITGQAPGRKEVDRKAYLLFGMMNWIFGWYSPKKHGSEKELVEDIYSTFTNGIVGRGAGNGTAKNRR